MGLEKLVAIENQGFSKEGRSFRLRVSGTLALCGRSPGSVGAPLVRQREAAVCSVLRRSRPARALASVPAPARVRTRCPRVATDEFHVTEDRKWCDCLLCLQPLKVVDPDHPLAMLVRKAQADSPAPTPPAADGAAGQPSQVEYAADCEYLALRPGCTCTAQPPGGSPGGRRVWQRCPAELSLGSSGLAIHSMRPHPVLGHLEVLSRKSFESVWTRSHYQVLLNDFA